MSELDEVVREFLVESHEGLDRLDRDLVALEHRPRDRELLAGIFRCIHTIKGTCGFLAFEKLEKVSHVGESLLSLLRDGKLELNPAITSALLRLVDAVRQILASIEKDGHEGDIDYDDLIALLTKLQTAEPEAPAVPAEPEVAAIAAAKPKATKAKASRPKPARAVEPVIAEPQPSEPAPAPAAAAEPGDGRASVSESNIRVDVGLLDNLMNLVGELVLARNQILQFSGALDDAAFTSTTQRLNLITTELQEQVMKTRMQPIGNVWSKFPRVVRDLAVACGKQVAIDMQGKDTELDKTIIEAIKDPLTHIVRNSVDHGIESPAIRRAGGKPAEGRLLLSAYHEGGQVNIEISDDGAGVNLDRVRQKALDRGLITPDQAARLTEREICNLLFLPGFSTAEKITNVSGRGVGMDVVKTNIEKIGGTVDIGSVSGQGTTIKIKIPLTLAIIPALTVSCGDNRFCIPQVSLLELVRVAGGGRSIERIHGAPVYRLRGSLLPLVYLRDALGLGASGEESPADVNIVVLQAGERPFGLVVDEVNDTEEIVVKPLGKQLKGLPVFAGATIMGDGRVALILDVPGLAQHAHVVRAGREHDRAQVEGGAAVTSDHDRQTLLVFELGSGRRSAIPLSLVARLEELPRESVERAGGAEVVQYRGEILSLLRLSSVLGAESGPDRGGPLQVVVYADQGHQVGLVVDFIVDIVEEAVRIERPVDDGTLLGSAVVQRQVTDLLDVRGIVRRAHPGWYAAASSTEAA